jgi:hypothetical protein
VHFSNHFPLSVHVNIVNSADNQRLYLMMLLRALGLNDFGLSVMFDTLILSQMLYASQAFKRTFAFR